MDTETKSDVLDILITSNINSFSSQRRFVTDLKIGDLKRKLELLTGALSSSMELQLLDDKNQIISNLADDNACLNAYNLMGAKTLHVIDFSHHAGEFEDVSKVQKYEISDENYSKRAETYRAFKEKFLQDDSKKVSDEMKKINLQKLQEEEAFVKSISVGSRCEVKIARNPIRRGTVMYVGKTEFKSGFWVGVKYDEPLGKNDGSVGGKRYFECLPNYGSFVKPHDITVGDFPEETYELDEI